MRAHSKGAEMTRPPIDFDALAGQEIPDGCDQCEAYQTVESVSPGVWELTIHHEDSCPILRASRAGRN